MSSLPKEAYLSLKDKARANYTKLQFTEDFKKYIDHAINSEEIKEIDISQIIFPEGYYFRLGEFLPDCEVKNRKICEKTLIAHNTVFSGNVSLGSIDFKQMVEFDGAIFNRRFLAQGARFHSNINFSGSEFLRQSNFSKTEYLLSCSVNFYHSRFHESVSFADSKFHEDSDLIFDYSRFKDVAFFNNTEFQGKVGFSDAIFESSCNFSFAKFFQDANFAGTYFTRLTRFTGIQLSHLIEFKRSFFFENCLFNHLNFKNQGRISFDDISVRESTRIVVGAIDSIEGSIKKERIRFQRFSMILDSPAIVIKDCKSFQNEQPLLGFANCFFE
ncbi:MAG TPA: pentapeptide repeat-containing protein, partial [Vampirovibrionales bacterium]